MVEFFVKSLEDDFATKRLEGEHKVVFQTVENMIEQKRIRPNTRSFGLPARLSTTMLHENYCKTYRSQGIIFQTNERPAYIFPFDLVLLSEAKKIISQYYRIKESLHLFYNHPLLEGFEKFVFSSLSEMLERFPTPEAVWREVTEFRQSKGLSKLPKEKFRLAEYNEAVFLKSIRIVPVAIFGRQARARSLARQYGLLYTKSAKDFFDKYGAGMKSDL